MFYLLQILVGDRIRAKRESNGKGETPSENTFHIGRLNLCSWAGTLVKGVVLPPTDDLWVQEETVFPTLT